MKSKKQYYKEFKTLEEAKNWRDKKIEEVLKGEGKKWNLHYNQN